MRFRRFLQTLGFESDSASVLVLFLFDLNSSKREREEESFEVTGDRQMKL